MEQDERRLRAGNFSVIDGDNSGVEVLFLNHGARRPTALLVLWRPRVIVKWCVELAAAGIV